MTNKVNHAESRRRSRDVDMSSEAITRRLREVGELNELGLSLAKAKPIQAPNGKTQLRVEVDANSKSEKATDEVVD